MIKILLFALLMFVVFFMWCILKVSSEASRIEEEYFNNDDYSNESNIQKEE